MRITSPYKMLPGLCLLLVAENASASCSITGGGLPYVSRAGGSPAPIRVDPSLPNGRVLYTWAQRLDSGPSFRCTSTIGRLQYFGAGPANGQIYATSVPGIGVRMKYNTTNGQTWPTSITVGGTTWPVSGNIFQVELIKTGRVDTAGNVTGEIGYSYVPSHASKPLSIVWATPIRIEPNNPTCSVDNPTQPSVSLGNHPLSQFPTVGSTSEPRANFSIRLRCSGGGSGGGRNLYVTLTDSRVPGNRSNVLNLAASATARGFGVRITRSGNQIVSYGPASTSVGNTNQWLAGRVSTGTSLFTIPLQAQLVRIPGVLTNGSTNATVTFTMAYE
jgi:type 1 fimbria pilin